VFGEMAEVNVTRDQRYIVVDAGLRDECITETGLQSFAKQEPARSSGTEPIALRQCKHGYAIEQFHRRGSRLWGTQKLCHDDWRQNKLVVVHSIVDRF